LSDSLACSSNLISSRIGLIDTPAHKIAGVLAMLDEGDAAEATTAIGFVQALLM
jgi:hypothetical protein